MDRKRTIRLITGILGIMTVGVLWLWIVGIL